MTFSPPPSEEEKIEGIANHFRAIMEILGLDTTAPSLAATPKRVAKMYVQEVFAGLQEKNFPTLTLFDKVISPEDEQLIVVKDIVVNSFCEHHFIPFYGTATVAYIPNGKVLGLSKINRIVRHFAQRPQVQERLTTQILDMLAQTLGTDHVAITITAVHLCVKIRGVQENSSMTTHGWRGRFKTDPELRHQIR